MANAIDSKAHLLYKTVLKRRQRDRDPAAWEPDSALRESKAEDRKQDPPRRMIISNPDL